MNFNMIVLFTLLTPLGIVLADYSDSVWRKSPSKLGSLKALHLASHFLLFLQCVCANIVAVTMFFGGLQREAAIVITIAESACAFFAGRHLVKDCTEPMLDKTESEQSGG